LGTSLETLTAKISSLKVNLTHCDAVDITMAMGHIVLAEGRQRKWWWRSEVLVGQIHTVCSRRGKRGIVGREKGNSSGMVSTWFEGYCGMILAYFS